MELVSFTDYPALREEHFNKVKEGVIEGFPIKNDQFELSVTDVAYAKSKPYTKADMSKAILNKDTLSKKLTGKWILKDSKTGNIVGSTNRKTLMKIPYLTDHGTYIRKGIEYGIATQMRLVPTVYTHKTSDGFVASQVNIKNGTGHPFKILLEPSTGVFYMKSGGRKLQLYPILNAMGITDGELTKAWGEGVLKQNKSAKVSPHIHAWIQEASLKANEKYLKDNNTLQKQADMQPNPSNDVQIGLQRYFTNMQIDPEATEMTLGHPYSNVSKDVILGATNKALSISRGEAEEDDRDSLAFQTMHGLGDFLKERVKLNKGGLMSKVLWKAATRPNELGKVIPANVLDKHVDHIFNKSGVSQVLEGINPMELYNQNKRVIRLGEGALSIDAAPDSARGVNPSQALFLDPIKSPECFPSYCSVMTDTGWKTWDEVTYDTLLACNINNTLEYHTPLKLTKEHYIGPMYVGVSENIFFTVTPNHRIRHYTDNEWVITPAKDITKDIILDIGTHKGYSIDKPVKTRKESIQWLAYYIRRGFRDKDKQGNEILHMVYLQGTLVHDNVKEVLDSLKVKYTPTVTGFDITDEHILAYTDMYDVDHKTIPNVVFDAPIEYRLLFLETLFVGQHTYMSSSRYLIRQLERLAFTCGIPSHVTYTESSGISTISLKYYTNTENIPTLSVVPFKGIVACATVPGGLLYVSSPDSDGHWSGNSLKVGLDLYAARNAKLGRDNKIYTKVIDTQTNTEKYVTPMDVARTSVAFPGELKTGKKYVQAIINGKDLGYVDRKDVGYEMPSGDALLSDATNNIPFVSSSKGMRVLMGSKFTNAALPLTNREAPLVRVQLEDGTDLNKELGKYAGAVYAPEKGIITKVTKDFITYKNDKGVTKDISLYNQYTLPRKTSITNYTQVKVGDSVDKDTLLASSNFTDHEGQLATGVNLYTGYFPMDGKNYEDASIISESAAKKLAGQRTYTIKGNKEDNIYYDKGKYTILFPGKFTKDQLNTLDDKGRVKPGTILQYGDPIVLATEYKSPTMSSLGRPMDIDKAEIWTHHYPGIVTKTHENKAEHRVVVQSVVPMQVGDKLAMRMGGKGVQAEIVPNDQMPHNKEGKPLELVLSSLGIVTRCYDADTEFLTRRGWVYGKDVTDNDELFIYDNLYDTSTWDKQLSEFHKSDYTGDMYGATNKDVDFLVSPNHTMLAKLDGASTFVKCKIEDIYGKDNVKLPIISASVMGNNTKVSHTDTNLAVLLAICNTGGSHYKDSIVIDHRIDYLIDPIQVLDALEIPVTYINDDIWIAYTDIAKHTTVTCNRVPQWIFNADKECKLIYLSHIYYNLYTEGSEAIIVDSELFRDNLHMLLISVGKPANAFNTKDKYGIQLKGSTYEGTINKDDWYTTEYTGKIYCPTVATGYVYTRRKGKVIIAGNTNPNQLLSAQLGKVAKKTGKPYSIKGFSDKDFLKFVKQELADNDLTDTEDLIDPKTGKTLPKVFTGQTYQLNQVQTADYKGKSRSTASYTFDEEPSRGGESGSKHLGPMEYDALLAHGADHVIQDLKQIKGRKNTEFWKQLKLGGTPTMPGTPLIYSKFVNLIKAAGINFKETPEGDNIFAMTNKEAKDMTGENQVLTSDTFGANSEKPIKGGLFDNDITGFGRTKENWSYIKLPEPLPNPVMEDSLRSILNLTKKQFKGVLEGKHELNGKTGPKAMLEALQGINVPAEINLLKNKVETASASKKNLMVKRLKFLRGLERNNVKPADFMMTRIPVLPPKFRPIINTPNSRIVSDMNFLYKNIIESIQDYKESEGLPSDIRNEAIKDVYDRYHELVGLSDPSDIKLEEKNIGGIFKQLFGKGQVKHSMVQRRVIGSNLDISGLGVIVPDPKLRLDEVGIPENKAWELYSPFVIRKLIQGGNPAQSAALAVERHTDNAKSVLQQVMKERPVLLNRAPTLHKYSIMAFTPKLVKGDTVKINPSIVSPFNADFDGDQQINKVIMGINKSLCNNPLEKVSSSSIVPLTHKYTKIGEDIMSYIGLNVSYTNDFDFYAIDLEDFPHKDEHIGTSKKGNAKFYAVDEGIKVIAFSEKSCKPKLASVSCWSKHINNEVWVVTLSNGRQIFTDDDERAVYGIDPETLEYTRARPKDAKNLLVPCLKDTSNICTESMQELNLDYKDRAYDDNYVATYYLKDTLQLDKYTGYFIGAACGDGWVSTHKEEPVAYCISGIHTGVIDRVKETAKAFFNTPDEIHWNVKTTRDSYGDSTTYTLNSRHLARVLLPFIGKGAVNKHLPSFWHLTSREFRLGLLSGLLDTDGTVCVTHGKKKPQLSSNISSTSLRLLRETQQLLRTLGVSSKITFSKKTSVGNDFWILSISAIDLYDIKDELYCGKEKISESFKEARPSKTSPAYIKTDIVPISKGLATKIADAEYAASPKREKGTGYGRKPSKLYTILKLAAQRGYISRDAALRACDKYELTLLGLPNEWLDIVYNKRVTWAYVKTVEDTNKVEVGYDLTVPGFETFASLDGVILSNTMAYTTPVTRAAVHEAKTKMMPSQHLISSGTGKPNYTPRQEYSLGLYLATKNPRKGNTRYFRTKEEALKEYNAGKLKIDDPIVITS